MLLHKNKKLRCWVRSPKNVIIALLTIVILVLLLIIIPHRGWLSAQIMPLVDQIRTFPKGKVYSQSVKYLPASASAEVDKVYLHIDYKNFQKLAYMREQALKDSANKQFEYVKAELEQADDMFDVKIRLKGDRVTHFNHPTNWSFRVKTKGSATVYGMKYFSLQKPIRRNYMHEWMFHKTLEREDILSLQYKFINLFVNGSDLGVYAIEEHFDKRLVERQKRREGPIIRFQDRYGEMGLGLSDAQISAFRVDDQMSESNRNILQAGIDTLEAFRQGDLLASEAFDTEKLATFFAICDLLGTHHGTLAKSIRFYYNPINTRLEPVGFDGHYGNVGRVISAEAAVDPRCKWMFSLYQDWYESFFNNRSNFDKKFFESYIRKLRKVSSPEYLELMLSELQPEIENNLAILHKDFPLLNDRIFSAGPDLFVFDTEEYIQRQKYIRSVLDEKPQIQAFLQRHADGMRPNEVSIAFANTFRLPVEIVTVTAGESTLVPLQEDRVLLGKLVSQSPQDVPSMREFTFKWPEGYEEDANSSTKDLTITYRMVGSNRSYETEALPFPYDYQGGRETKIMRSPGTHLDFPFIKVNEADKKILITQGKHHLHSDLVFPEGYTVIAGPGVSIDLHDSAMILSKSPIQFLGSEDSPIVIESSDGTGQGMSLILESSNEQASILDYVEFKNLTSPSKDKWSVTGAITIYQAKVDISNSSFMNNQSEDCLNLVRSTFKLYNVSFANTFSDALDLDFSNGSIVDSEFINSGNDAIDFSGSIVTIKDVMIKKVGDKAISVGEKSAATASRIRIDGAEIALTCKDQSTLTIDDCTISNSRIGVTAYQKKPEFGPGSITATNLTQTGSEVPYMIEKRSTMTLDGKAIASKYKKVKDLLYGAEYGKSSK